MKIKYFIPAVIVLMLLASAVPVVHNNQPAVSNSSSLITVTGTHWYSPESDKLVSPGMNNVPLFVNFTSVKTVDNLNVTLNLKYFKDSPFSCSYINGPDKMVKNNVSYKIFQAGEPGLIYQFVNISPVAGTGYYEEALVYNYTINGTFYSGNTTFIIPLLGNVRLSVLTSYFGEASEHINGTPGMKNIPLTVILENLGNMPVSNITVMYKPSNPLTGYKQYENISALNSFGVVNLTFIASIKNVNDSFYRQNLTLYYNGACHNTSFMVPVTGYSNISLVSYYSNPPVIYQNEKFIKMTFVLENSGNSFKKDLNVSLYSKYFKVVSPDYYHLKYFEPGVINVTFYVNAMNITGYHKVYLSIDSMNYTINERIHSSGYNDLKISSGTVKLLSNTKKQLMTFYLNNTGNKTFRDVEIHLLTPSVISIHVSSSNPLSALDVNNVTFSEIRPGQSIKVTFIVDTSPAVANGTYPSQILVTWHFNNTQELFTKTYNFNAKISPTISQKVVKTFTDPLYIIIIVLIVIVLILIGIVAARSRKGKKESKSENKKE
ncbi:COG1361 S-layer family protein [Picrophilus oshimae]|uniref:Uncharacterized conserved protein n=1 Tax=Picrophilus torridus (strain ATCC 700027 / DSM 9790 / JCM 10055 / NBRC 100828 / KAW 2/3) TaxID=1122961 RepID=A0A8G2FVN6_PICTO|nr:COG1361 S-layer family protein [Picrophilus oshimae]SMD30309.1 Uncharacterized conserved protein [Picrophilus oshimae DSM 9789]